MADVLDPAITGVKRIEATTAIELEAPYIRDKDWNRSIDQNGNLILAWSVQSTRTVSIKTATYTITNADSGTVFSNEWATSKVTFNLPPAMAGLSYIFAVYDADWMDIQAGSWDVIRRDPSTVTATAGKITSTDKWSSIQIIAINNFEWTTFSLVWTRS